MINYNLINHERFNQIARSNYNNDELEIFLHDNRILLRTFQINHNKLIGLIKLLESIDNTLFLDIGHDIRTFYYLYYENLSEPKISNLTLKRFCYFRILSMIKSVLFNNISRGMLFPLSDIKTIFDSVLYEKLKIVSVGNKIYFKDHISNLKLNLKFLLNYENNSIGINTELIKEIQNLINNKSIHSLFYEIYLRLLSVFSHNPLTTSEEEFEYIINLSLVFSYLYSALKQINILDRCDHIQRKRRISNASLILNIKDFSLLNILISHNELDVLHKTLSFLDIHENNIVYPNKNIVDSYLLLHEICD